MTIAELPELNLPRLGHRDEPARPLLCCAWAAPTAHRVATERFRRGYIIVPQRGAYWIRAAQRSWLVLPGQALWIPPATAHELFSPAAVSAQLLFIDPLHCAALPPACVVLQTSPWLVGLLLRCAGHGNDYPAEGPAARIAQVLLDEFARLPRVSLLLPASRDLRLARAMARLIERPRASVGLVRIAQDCGASARTLARLFQAETGMTFTQWKTRLLLLEALARMARGVSVTEVAVDLGYRSTSSFVYMFRRNLGVPPGRYRQVGETRGLGGAG